MWFLFVLMLFTACKGAQKPYQEPVSDPDFAVSGDGTMLVVENGVKTLPGGTQKKEGFCVLRTSSHNLSDRRLLTVNGSLSRGQLSSTMRYVGYPERLAVFAVALIATVLVGRAAGAMLDAKTVHDFMVIGVGVGFMIKGAKTVYYLVRGRQEGEKIGPTVAQSATTALVPVVGSLPTEFIQRWGRVDKLISKLEELKITDQKMGKVIERVRDTKGKYSGNCDHLKT